MWQNQNPNQRAKAVEASRKRQRERYRRPLHIRKVLGQLKAEGTTTPLETNIVLNDLSPKGVGIYSYSPVHAGTMVVLVLEEPRHIEIKGKVVWTQKQTTASRIVSAKTDLFRVGIQFVFANAEEQKTIEAFCQELFKHYLYADPTHGTPETGSDSDSKPE